MTLSNSIKKISSKNLLKIACILALFATVASPIIWHHEPKMPEQLLKK